MPIVSSTTVSFGLMETIDKLYKSKEHELKLYFDTMALSRLLMLNHEIFNNKYNKATVNDVLKIVRKSEAYIQKKDNMMIRKDAGKLWILLNCIVKK